MTAAQTSRNWSCLVEGVGKIRFLPAATELLFSLIYIAALLPPTCKERRRLALTSWIIKRWRGDNNVEEDNKRRDSFCYHFLLSNIVEWIVEQGECYDAKMTNTNVDAEKMMKKFVKDVELKTMKQEGNFTHNPLFSLEGGITCKLEESIKRQREKDLFIIGTASKARRGLGHWQ